MSTQEIPTAHIDTTKTNYVAEKRVQIDLKEIENLNDIFPIIFVDPVDGNRFHLEAALSGPMSTPYENGVFLLDIKLPNQYPFSPPQSIVFKRAIMHPNVNEYGKFISNAIKLETWTPSMTIKTILEHIWACLAVPDIDTNECDITRALSYKTDKERFEILAREYSVKYAQAT